MIKKFFVVIFSVTALLLSAVLFWIFLYNLNSEERLYICSGKILETGQTESRPFAYKTAFGDIVHLSIGQTYYYQEDNFYYSDDWLMVIKNFEFTARAVKFNRITKSIEVIIRGDGRAETFVGSCISTSRG